MTFDIYIPIITNIVVAFGFVGNCITFVSIMCIKDLRTPTHMFIASLSFADMCCLINQRFAMSYQVLKKFISFELFLSISGAFLQTSTNHTIALSVFRLQMMIHPLQFRQKITFKRTTLYIGLCWLVGTFVGVIIYFTTLQKQLRQKATRIVAVLSVFYVIIPQLILLAIHVWKIRVLRTTAIASRQVTTYIQRLSRMICVIVTLNVATLLPIWIGYLSLSIVTDIHNTQEMLCYDIPVTFILLVFHHSLNPVLFFLMSKPFTASNCCHCTCKYLKNWRYHVEDHRQSICYDNARF